MIPLLGFAGSKQSSDFAMRGLRCNGVNQYMSRSPSAGNYTVWTFSGWLKVGSLGATGQYIILGYINGSNVSSIHFTATGALGVANWISGVAKAQKITNRLFRDNHNWMHVLVASNGASALEIHVNRELITSFATDVGPTSDAWYFNWGASTDYLFGQGASYMYNGYAADLVWIDGTFVNDPDQFTRLEPSTGRILPRPNPVDGLTMGTNGFWLSFDDDSSAAAIGYDDAGGARGSAAGSNDWTVANFVENSEDSPMEFDDGAGTVLGNYATFSTSDKNPSIVLTHGNLVSKVPSAVTTHRAVRGSLGISDRKFYFEQYLSGTSTTINAYCGASTSNIYNTRDGVYCGQYAKSFGIGKNSSSSQILYSGMTLNYDFTSGFANGAYGFAIDPVEGKVWICDSTGAWVGGGDPAAGTDPTLTFTPDGEPWFPMASFYNCTSSTSLALYTVPSLFVHTPPTGFYPCCSKSMSPPLIGTPHRVHEVVTYTGDDGTSHKVPLLNKPDLVWIKSRGSTDGHALVDSVRGGGAYLQSDATAAEQAATIISAWDEDGITLGSASSLVNSSSYSYALWSWKKGVTPGFDIVSYTGTGALNNVAHSLEVAPDLIITKNRDAASDWWVFHSALGATKYMVLDSTAAAVTSANAWNDTAPTSSQFTLGASNPNNVNTQDAIAYLFAQIPGFSKLGGYYGNGNVAGPFVYCGFTPRFLMIKRTGSTGSWVVWDLERGLHNPASDYLLFNSTSAESSASGEVDLISNGFTLRNANVALNNSGEFFLYWACANIPEQYARAV